MVIMVMCIISGVVTFLLSRLERDLKFHMVIFFVLPFVPIIHVLAGGFIPITFLVAYFMGMIAEYIYNLRYK
jgi:uncharacterized membrane protein